MATDDLVPAPPLPSERRLALVIATSTYTDGEYPDLPAPAHDASNISAMLADSAICGFEVQTLFDRPGTEIRLAINKIFNGRDRNDLVLVYFSGHGVKDDHGRLHIVATDTDSETLPATAIASRYLMDLAKESAAGKQVIILDCCFSGAFDAKGVGLVDLVGSDRQVDEAVAGGRCILTSSRSAEYSFQNRLASGEIAGSVFTTAMIEGIRTGQADLGNNGRITVQDAYRYAFAAVTKDNRRQTPQFNMYGAEGAAILLARNPIGVRVGAEGLFELLAALDSPHQAIRIAAVDTLGELLHDDNPAKSEAARRRLQTLATTDGSPLAPHAQRLLADGTEPDPVRHIHRPAAEEAPPRPAPRYGVRPSPRPRRDTEFVRAADAEPAAVVDPAGGVPTFTDEEIGPVFLTDEFDGLVPVEDPLGVFGPGRVLPLEDEPSTTVSRYLYPTERYRGEWRRHWIDPAVSMGLAGWATGRATRPVDPHLLHLPPHLWGIATADAATWALIAIAVLAAWRTLSWPFWRMTLTNKQIMLVRGLLWRRTSTIPLQPMTHAGLSQSPLGRILNYATLSFAVGRRRTHRIRYLPNPNELWLRIQEEKFEPAAVEARLGTRHDDDSGYDD